MFYYSEDLGAMSKEELDDEDREAVCLKCKNSVGVTFECVGTSKWLPQCDMCGGDVMGIHKKGMHPVRLFLEHIGKWRSGAEGEFAESDDELNRRFLKWSLGYLETNSLSGRPRG